MQEVTDGQAYATGHIMERQGVAVLCVWNKFMESYEKRIFVVRKCHPEQAALKDTLKTSSPSSPADPVGLIPFFLLSVS